MLTIDSHIFCPYLVSHRGRDISVMTHNYFLSFVFLSVSLQREMFLALFAY